MTKSQIKLMDWYKSHTDRFDDIEKEDHLPSGEIKIETKTHIYLVGIRGGLQCVGIKQ